MTTKQQKITTEQAQCRVFQHLRRSCGLSLTEAATLFEMRLGSIHKIENEKRPPPAQVLQDLSNLFVMVEAAALNIKPVPEGYPDGIYRAVQRRQIEMAIAKAGNLAGAAAAKEYHSVKVG